VISLAVLLKSPKDPALLINTDFVTTSYFFYKEKISSISLKNNRPGKVRDVLLLLGLKKPDEIDLGYRT